MVIPIIVFVLVSYALMKSSTFGLGNNETELTRGAKDTDPALIRAIKAGSEHRVMTLLASGVDVNMQNKSGDTALTWAKNHPDIVAALTAAGAMG